MSTVNIKYLTQIAVGLFLIVLILLQAKGVGLSASFGGEGGFYRTKRGLEKLIFVITVIMSIIYVATSLYSLVSS